MRAFVLCGRKGGTSSAETADRPMACVARVRVRRMLTLLVGVTLLEARTSLAQQPQQAMGTVATQDARVSGGLAVRGEQAALMTNVSVTAYDRTAPIALNRGGEVLVCSTSEFHLLRSGSSGALVFGLDRGALEIRSTSQAQDLVLTPDLKFRTETPGELDLRLRVTREGDTCVDNAGAKAPVLNATDAFSNASYRVMPGQHVMFVKGDLKQVVDRERSPCGCPASPTQLAGKPGEPNAAGAAHPFPEAQSEGLAPTAAPGNEAPVGAASSQVSTSFSYGDGQGPPPGTAAAPGATGAGTPVAVPAATLQPSGGFFHAIGHFFHRLFHPSKQPDE